MQSIIKMQQYNIIVDGASIRLISLELNDRAIKCKAGIVSILPKVQVALGQELSIFMQALELSRLPLALRKTISKGTYEVYDILRLPTGNIKEAIIATLSVISGTIVGVTYNRNIVQDKEFRKLVKLSAMHQIAICSSEDPMRLFKAADCVRLLTGIDRDKLIVTETVRSLKVRVNFKSKLNLPIYYIFALDKSEKYKLLQISYDYNEVIRTIK